jgi:hypothetical protein
LTHARRRHSRGSAPGEAGAHGPAIPNVTVAPGEEDGVREESQARPDGLDALLEGVDITRLPDALLTDLSAAVYAHDLAALVPAALARVTRSLTPDVAFNTRWALHYLLGVLGSDGFVLEQAGEKTFALTTDGPIEVTGEEIRRSVWLLEVAIDAELAARVLEVAARR